LNVGKIMLTISIKFIAVPCRSPAEEDDTACHHETLSEYELKLYREREERKAGRGESEITVECTRRCSVRSVEKRALSFFPRYLPKVYLELRREYDVAEEKSLKRSGIKCPFRARPP